MIKLQLDRFDDPTRILVLKEVEGHRHLFIRIGEDEAKEFRRVMRFLPRSLGASRAEWMELVERQGAQLNAVAITELVDGVFKASVYLTKDGRSFYLPARPAEALEYAMRKLVPIWATDVVMRLASVDMQFDDVAHILAGAGQETSDFGFSSPVATFTDPSNGWMKRHGMWFARIMTVTYGVFATIVVFLTLAKLARHLIGTDWSVARRDLFWFLPIYVALGLGFYLLYFLHSAYRPGAAQLHIFPFGAGVWKGKLKAAILWSSLERTGCVDWSVPDIDGLKAKDRRFGIGGLSLSPYDKHWREGEIGWYIRCYSPRLLGIEPVDPDGGATIF